MAHRATFTQSPGRKSGRGCLHGARQEYVVHDALLSSIDEATSLEQMPVALKMQKTVPALAGTAWRYTCRGRREGGPRFQ